MRTGGHPTPSPATSGEPRGAASRWDRFYGDTTYLQTWPRESIIRHLARRRRARDFRRGLDFGCGIGRGCWLLHSAGMAAVGIDVSLVALQRARVRVTRGDFAAGLAQFDGARLPLADGMFDLVIADGVLDHVRLDDAEVLVRELHRVLRPDGEFVATLASARDPLLAELPHVALRTAVIEEGPEEGLIQRFFTEQDCQALLAPFARTEIVELEEHHVASSISPLWSRWTVAGYKDGTHV